MRKQIKGILAAALSAAMVVSLGSAAGVNKASAEDTTTEAKHTYNAILGFDLNALRAEEDIARKSIFVE